MLGVVLLTKILDICLSQAPEATYLIILGFLIGSIVPIYPGNPAGWEIPLSVLTFAVGAVIIYMVSMKELKMSEKEVSDASEH